MLNPDEIQYYVAIPAFVILMTIWITQEVRARRRQKKENDNQ